MDPDQQPAPGQARRKTMLLALALVPLAILGLAMAGQDRDAHASEAIVQAARKLGEKRGFSAVLLTVERENLLSLRAKGTLGLMPADEEIHVVVTQAMPFLPWVTRSFERRRRSDGALLGSDH